MPALAAKSGNHSWRSLVRGGLPSVRVAAPRCAPPGRNEGVGSVTNVSVRRPGAAPARSARPCPRAAGTASPGAARAIRSAERARRRTAGGATGSGGPPRASGSETVAALATPLIQEPVGYVLPAYRDGGFDLDGTFRITLWDRAPAMDGSPFRTRSVRPPRTPLACVRAPVDSIGRWATCPCRTVAHPLLRCSAPRPGPSRSSPRAGARRAQPHFE